MNRGIITIPDFGSGFFSNYFSVLSMIIIADQQKLEPWVDLRRTAFVEGYNPYLDKDPPENSENPWDWWFEQIKLNDNDKLFPIPYDITKFNQTEKLWNRADLPYARNISEKYIKIKQHILDRVNIIFEEEFKNKIVLGVMARGTEMNKIHPEYGDQTIATWLNKTSKILKKNKNIDRIFVVTEDKNYLDRFNEEFDNVFYLKDVFRRTTESLEYTIKYPLWPCLNTERINHCKLLGEEMLIQALLLSKCEYLIVKQSGVSSAAIFFSHNLKDVYYTPTFILFNRYLNFRLKLHLVLSKLFI